LDRPDRLTRVGLDLLDGLADLLEVDVVEPHDPDGVAASNINYPINDSQNCKYAVSKRYRLFGTN
jgi:hypothetical protein